MQCCGLKFFVLTPLLRDYEIKRDTFAVAAGNRERGGGKKGENGHLGAEKKLGIACGRATQLP